MKKRIVSMLLAVLMVCSVITTTAMAEVPAQDENVKFFLSATSVNAVSATVYDDYSAVLDLPEDGTVNIGSAVIAALMQNVASLGVEEARSHELTVNTGLGDQTVDLKNWLGAAYTFEGAKINATVDYKEVEYTLSACEDNQITATADEDAARAAWWALTQYVDTTTQEEDSFVLIANGSSIKIGEEYLRFADGNANDLKLDNLNNVSGLNQSIRDALYLDTCDDTETAIEAEIKKGTKLAVGSTVAELTSDCTVKVDFKDKDEFNGLKGKLTALRDAPNNYTLVQELVKLVNDAIDVVGNVPEVDVTIAFTDHQHIFDCEVTDDAFFAEKATCQHGTLYYYSCACGDPAAHGVETFDDGETVDHKYVNGICEYCHRAEPKDPVTPEEQGVIMSFIQQIADFVGRTVATIVNALRCFFNTHFAWLVDIIF